MLAARARVPFACMIWQVVPSTSTRKSINLDLARASRYWYFTKNRPAHADQNSDQSSSSRQSSCCTCWAWRRVRMDTKSPGRSACSGPAPHTHTQARHTHVHTHTLTPHNQFLQVYSYTTRSILERDIRIELPWFSSRRERRL